MMTATAISLALPAPLPAQAEQRTVISGRCLYPDRAARYRYETVLVLCDTATIGRGATNTTLDFSQRSWGSMARFTGDMPADRMTVTRVTLRDGKSLAATGTCEIFHSNGNLSAISCLARAGSQSIAANFVPSRL